MTRYIPGEVFPRGNVLWVWPMQHGLMEYGQVESRLCRRLSSASVTPSETEQSPRLVITSQPVGLPHEEFEQRMEQAIKARFNEDLEPLFADLPRTAEPTQSSGRIVRPRPNSRGR